MCRWQDVNISEWAWPMVGQGSQVALENTVRCTSGWVNGVNSGTKTFLGFLSMLNVLFPFICKRSLLSAIMITG